MCGHRRGLSRVRHVCDCGHGGVEIRQNDARVREKNVALREELHSLRSSLEQLRTELVLEGANLPAHWRLRYVDALGGASDMALFGDCYEVTDLREAHPLSIRTLEHQAEIKEVLDAERLISNVQPVSIEIFSGAEIARLRKAGSLAAETLASVGARLQAGVTTADVEEWVRQHTADRGGKPSQLGYKGFPHAVCTSVNNVVCHGMPSKNVVLRGGDILNVDVTTELGGFHGDTSETFIIGTPSVEARHVVDVARRCRDAGVAVVREGARLGDIGAAIQDLAQSEGCSVVRDFGGHGIGRRMHTPPHVSHVGIRGAGMRLRAGMAITIEPMVNLGRAAVRMLGDGWTVVTEDGRLSAQFEHTIVVTREGAEIMTRVPSG